MQKTTEQYVTFARPFSLSNVDEVQPPGTYRIETVEAALEGLTTIAYLRVATTIEIPAIGATSRSRQVVPVSPEELDAALEQDVRTSGSK